MNSIKVNKGNFNVGRFELKDKFFNIGRHTSNDLSLNDSTVSGEHARITSIMKTSYIQDLGSTNGTFVNGRKVQQQVLRNDDIVTIGEYSIMFISEDLEVKPSKDRDIAKTVFVAPLKS